MDYYDIGDKITRGDLNSLVYLLRKFKKLITDLELGASTVKTEYGELHFSDGFKSTGSNWIIEDDVTVTCNDALKNSFYTFVFTVFDKNLSGNVNYRTVSVKSDSTGDKGILNVEIPTEAFEDGDIILADYQVQIVFDEHEYYTPLTNYNVTLTVEKDRILMYEDNSIYLTLKQGATVVPYALTSIIIGGEEQFATTDDNGVAEFIYTGKGAGRVDVTTQLDPTASVSFYDTPDYNTVVFTGSTVTFGGGGGQWLITDGIVTIDWGDGKTTKVNNPNTVLTHVYTDGETSHEILLIGEVKGLGKNFCNGRTNLQSVALLDGITSLGENCFFGCTGLTSVVMPNTVNTIGANCFYGCTGLTNVVLSENLTIINTGVFYGCTGLTSVTIPDGVTSIYSNCFYNCSGLTAVTLPNTLTTIGNSVFRNCSSLTDIMLPESLTTIGNLVFSGCSGLESLEIPNSVTGLGSYNFNSCSSLESIVLSDNITTLDNNSFYGCNSLTSINIPVNVSSIGANCFYGCTGLTTITIPSKVLNIGENAFKGCTGLTTVYISESVEVIGNNAFNGCTGLTNYQLYWTGNNIIEWSNAHLVNNTNTKYTTPNGTYDLYVNKNYPTNKLIERGYRLTLSSNKNIITTSETATITATLLNNGVAATSKTLNYTIKHGGTVLSSGTKTTNNNGQATITYNSTGVGNVEIFVSYSNVASKTYNIQDYKILDNGASDKSSNYSSYGATLSYNTDHYTISKGATGDYLAYIYKSGVTLGSNFEISCDMRITSGNNFGLVLTDTIATGVLNNIDRVQLFGFASVKGYYVADDNTAVNNQTVSGALSSNTWYTFYLKVENGDVTAKILQGTTEVYSKTTTINNITHYPNFSLGVGGLNAEVDWKNLKVYLLNYGKSLSIKSSKEVIYYDESVTISGVLLNDGLPVNNASVTIYQGSTSLGNVTTNSNGEYSKTVSGLSAGTHTFKATHDTIETNTLNITVNNHTYALSAALTNSSIYTDESTTISGVLTKDDKAYASQTVTIKDGNNPLGTVTTNTNGAYTKTINNLSAGSHTLKAEHTNASSSTVSLTVNSHSYSLTASASKTTIYNDESTVISGVLKKDNVAWAGQQVKIYDGSTVLDTVTTNSNGAYTKTVTGLSAGSHTLKAQHTNATSSNISITVNNHTYSLTCSANKTAIYNDESVTISGTLKKDNSLFANQNVTIYQGSTSLGTVSTNANGVYTKTVSGLSVGGYTFKAKYGSTESSTVTVTVSGHYYDLTASTDKTSMYNDESVTIGGVLTKDGNVYANQAVTVYDNNASKGTATTNSSGVYSKVLSGLSTGTHSLKVGYSGIYSSIVNVSVNSHGYALTCVLDKLSMDSNETVTITGNLKKDGVNWSNQSVTLYDGNNSIGTVSTNSSGNFSKSVTGLSVGTHSIRAVHNNVQSSTVGLTVNSYVITVGASASTIYSDGSVTISGVLKRNGSTWSGQTVTIYDGSTSKGTATTNSSGAYSLTVSGLTAGTHTFKAVNTKATSTTVNVTVNNHSYSLTASASPTSINYGGSITLSGVLKKDGANWGSQTVTVYDGSTSLGTVTTNSSGAYTKTITGLSAGSHTLKASHSNVQSSNVAVTVNSVYSLTASLSASSIYTDGSVTISGVLKRNNAVWSGQTITIYDGTTSKGTVTTDSNGAYSKTLSSLSAGTHTLKASHTNTTSPNVSLTVNNHSYSLTASANKSTMYTEESVTVSGVLRKDGSNWGSQTITVYDGSTSKGTATTNNSGAYSKAVSGLSAGTHTLKAQHTNATSGNISVTVKNHSYTLTCTASSGSINYGQSVTISGALKKDGANWSGQTITIKEGNITLATVTTDSNGAYSKNISGLSVGSHSINAVHTNATSGTATVTVKATEKIIATCTGSSITMGDSMEETVWLISNGDATIDWGDGTTSTVNNQISPLHHTFTNGSGSHTVKFSGNITGIGNYAFAPTIAPTGNHPELTSIEIKDGVTSIGHGVFIKCVNLASVIIPSTVTSIGGECFYGCSSLSEYNLYWTTSSSILTYDSSKMPITSNGKFKIPRGTTSLYTNKGYPSDKLQERS